MPLPARAGRAWMAVPALAAGALALAGSPAFAADAAPVYTVAQEGLTIDQGASLAKAFGIPNSIQPSGAFGYTSSAFAQVPQKTLGQGKDEAGRATVAQGLDLAAIKAIKPLPDASALKLGAKLISLAGLSPDLKATPHVSHTELDLADAAGRPTGAYPLDTAVSYDFTLGGLPVSGQGAKLRIAFAGDGSVTQLSQALRKLQRGRDVAIITPAAAAKQCAALYPAGVRQGTPTLGYPMPALGAADASGKGSVQTIYPTYTCNPSTSLGTQENLQLPAVAGAGPAATVKATLRAGAVSAAVGVTGGTAPYGYAWSSSSTTLTDNHTAKIAYTAAPRNGKDPETLTLTVTDANGLSSTASIAFAGDGSVSKASTPGGGGFGKLAIGPVDVGIEQTVDEWQCAQDSANGFHSSMAAHGIGVAFDFRGTNAWENDFKKASLGGHDSTFADNVDAQWYTGHGWPGGITFKNTAQDDGSIVPSDADWGNGDLEWLQLESCEVLRDTTGTNDYFGRWGQTINGLHMLNGFDTNAQCVNGGTGGDFADYLFPWQWAGITFRSALTVRQAWARMAIDKEPSGTKFRSMGNIAGNGVTTNIGDFFWGQGPTGPDIAKAGRWGMWAIAGTV